MTVAQARAAGVCRVCGEPICVPPGPVGWAQEFGAMLYPVAITLDFGAEFAHTSCLTRPSEETKP
jgi:hypothetical protein